MWAGRAMVGAMRADDSPGALPSGVEVAEVNRGTWADLERLFQARGGPKSCWCMVWRATPAESRHTDGASRQAALRSRVAAGVPVGLLAYLDGEPMAWCSVAPRPAYRRLGGPEDPDLDPSRVWSIVCFFVARGARGHGLMRHLLDSAIACARRQGAAVVGAYPVDPDSPSYRFMGFVPVFEAAGFTEVGRAGIRRHVMRLTMEPDPGR